MEKPDMKKLKWENKIYGLYDKQGNCRYVGDIHEMARFLNRKVTSIRSSLCHWKQRAGSRYADSIQINFEKGRMCLCVIGDDEDD